MDDYNMQDDANSIQWNNQYIYAEDALIENISIDNGIGYVTISYGSMGESNMISMGIVILIVSENTVIREQFGRQLTMWDLREGMTIDAIFSAAMTRSYPPQSNAYSIVVKNSEMPFHVRIDRIASIQPDHNFLYTGDPNNILDQMRFIVTEETIILDKHGNRIQLCQLKPGELVRIEHAIFQTASIPPQTTAFLIQVLQKC